MPSLQTRQFGEYSVHTVPNRSNGGAVVAVHNETGQRVGALTWHGATQESRSPNNEVIAAKPPTIAHATVLADHQRKGVGQAMFAYARGLEPELQHSPHLTPAGQAFARRTLANE